jgi:low affinity Fe/Cu permease
MNHHRHFRALRPRSALGRSLETLSRDVTTLTGSSWAFALAAAVIVVWLITGPLFRFSDTWQLVINTGTTIVTFLMVFLIQRSQNKDSMALQLKLNEIVAALAGASNRLIDIEDLTEQELRALHQHYKVLAEMAKRDLDLKVSHSVEEAVSRHAAKHEKQARLEKKGPRAG